MRYDWAQVPIHRLVRWVLQWGRKQVGYDVRYFIGIREYPSKKAALAAIQEVLYRYEPRERVERPDDQEFLIDLIQNHPDPVSKIGAGIGRFEVRLNWKTHGFWIIRVDGSETDFSFMKCLHPPTQQQVVRVALRHAVMDQVILFREVQLRRGPVVCPITGDLVDGTTGHVDHSDPTFFDLADAFVAERGGYEAIQVSDSVDGAIGRYLADSQVEATWQAYHRANANLRLVSVKANLSLLRRRLPDGS
jgi:Protein of unknown function (DUF3223)